MERVKRCLVRGLIVALSTTSAGLALAARWVAP